MFTQLIIDLLHFSRFELQKGWIMGENTLTFIETMQQLALKRIPFCVVSIIKAEGSVPRNSGKMIVVQDGIAYGTIGGGLAEAQAVDIARKCIQTGKHNLVRLDVANPVTGSQMNTLQDKEQFASTGKIEIYCDVFRPLPRLVIIGGGHVGRAIASCAANLDFQLEIVDERSDLVNVEKFPYAARLYCENDLIASIEKASLDESCYVIIATAITDQRAIRCCLRKKLAYLGLLGAKRKILELVEQLRAEGIEEDVLSSIYAPVGLDLGAQTPDEIAISILAEILAVKNGRPQVHMSILGKSTSHA
ncbi:MAG: XdhC/CoxI family protein [Rectinemataceae bacterium]